MAPSRFRDVTAVVPRRVVAGLIDLGLTIGLSEAVGSTVGSLGQVVLMLLYMVSHFVLLPGLRGITVGKLIMKLRLVNGEGNAPGIIPATVRTVAFLLDAPLLIGLMLMTGSPGHRRLGDTAAGTFVISAEDQGNPLPVDRFRMSADAPKPAKAEDPAIVARRVALDKKKQKKKRKDADPYIIPWTPGHASDAATRAKEADLEAMAAAAGNANRQGSRKPATVADPSLAAESAMVHTAWRPSDPNEEETPEPTGRAAKRAAARAEKQAKKDARAEANAAANSAPAPWTANQPAMAARTIAETPFHGDATRPGAPTGVAWAPSETTDGATHSPPVDDVAAAHQGPGEADPGMSAEAGKARRLRLPLPGKLRLGKKRGNADTGEAANTAQPWIQPAPGNVAAQANPTEANPTVVDFGVPGAPDADQPAKQRRLRLPGRSRQAADHAAVSDTAQTFSPQVVAAQSPIDGPVAPASPPWPVAMEQTSGQVSATTWVPTVPAETSGSAGETPAADHAEPTGKRRMPRLSLPGRRPTTVGSGETTAKADTTAKAKTTAKGSRIRLPRRKGQRDDDNTGEVPLLALPVATATLSPPAAAQSAQSQPASPSVRAASVGTVALAEPVGYARADWGAIDPDRAAEPQWDAERGSYVQFDVESWRWMIYVHEEELWRSLG